MIELKKGLCPHCNNEFEYWTTENTITHYLCGHIVEVEPCEPEFIEEPQSEVAQDGTVI